jgi:hypothetical protein
VLIRSNVAFTIVTMAQRTVVGLMGIRHRVTGTTTDERGRYLQLAECGSRVLTTVQENENTRDCPLCFEATGKPQRKRKPLESPSARTAHA